MAKKILSKIEEENDPSANVIPREEKTHKNNEESKESNTDLSRNIPPESLSVIPDNTLKSCNCKSSKCLKLYCECFANNKFCGAHCACNGCCNVPSKDEERLHAKEQILMRNPLAFRPKIETSLDDTSLLKQDIKLDKSNIQL